MKHRWMDVVKRSKDAISNSPKSDSKKQQTQQQQQWPSLAQPFGSARTLIPRSQSMIDVIAASIGPNCEFSAVSNVENPAFFHYDERCKSVGGACSVASVLENVVLQGGVHHTYMNVLTFMGCPLRVDSCCYSMSVQWFRAFGGHDDFQVIPGTLLLAAAGGGEKCLFERLTGCHYFTIVGACDEFFTATADDIGARILAKVMIEDEDVVKTKMLEYGPIKEDPEVRSKVEMYLERKSVLFMVWCTLSSLPWKFDSQG